MKNGVIAEPQLFQAPIEMADGRGMYFKAPSISTTYRDAITNLKAGEIIWNSTTGQLEGYDGSEWLANIRSFDRTIAATVDHSAGITEVSDVVDDYGTLVSGQTYRAFYARYNVRSTTPSNPVAEVTGIEGAVGSYVNDEALTFRGGYFRTYTNAGVLPSMRTAVGCEISARASYNGGTECVAESGTAFIGARIWMAPWFTAGSIGNINNFHALWIVNEAVGKFVTNAIKIDATTYGSGFTYCFNTDSGKFRLNLDGSIAGSGLVAGETVTTSGDDIMYVRAEDYRTLTAAQVYRGAYFRYNVRSTTPSNPVCEVTGIEGCAGSYINDEAITFRGGYFRTYIDANATYTMRTAVGCEISARASYSGGTECVAESGTAFVGARIWMAPYFTDATIPNVNNSHALWILNETPNGGAWGKYIDRAITIDATTYNSGFNYCFYTDTGKFYMYLNGAEAGSGVVKGERSTASGDDWFYVRVADYRTLTSAQEYNGGFFRYDVRATTPGSPQCEVNGIQGVASTYVADGNLLSMRGGLLRCYIQPGAIASAKTALGAEISARAGYSGGTDCQALSGTCFTGARIYMAPYFTSGTLANINNFWGLWIFGEHASQRNADAAIFISDAGGGFTHGIRFNQTMVPDATQTNAAIVLGTRATAGEKSITMTAATDQNFDPVQFNLNIIGDNPTNSSTINTIYQNITHDTTDMSFLRLKCADWNISIAKNIKDAYVYQGEIDITASSAIGSEATVLGLTMNVSAGTVTGLVRGAVIAMYGASMPANSAGLNINTGSGATLTHGIILATQGGTTMTNAIYIETAGTLTNVLKFGETSAAVVSKSDSGTTQSYTIRCAVGGVTGYLHLYTD